MSTAGTQRAWWLIALLVMGSAHAAPAEFHGLRVEPPKVLRGGLLLDQDAHETFFPLKRDGWQLVFFGYTHCPDICPMTLHKTGMLLKELGPESVRVTPVFISIDSGRLHAGALVIPVSARSAGAGALSLSWNGGYFRYCRGSSPPVA
jgi:hypothetical protein